MAATGKATILGQGYTWTSPRLKDIEQFEAEVGPITDLAIVNSVRGRVQLIHLCLREKHPELTIGVIGSWPVAAYSEMFALITQAIPLWEGARPPAPAPRDRGGEGRSGPSVQDSTPPSSESPDGTRNGPGHSA